MKAAVLADIHANLPALQAVLEDLPPVETVVCLGDVVGYYADPNEVCELLRDRSIPTIRGNHDAYVIGALTPHPDRVAAYRTVWTREVLRPDHLTWLKSLPAHLKFHWEQLNVNIHHATSWSEEGYLYPDSERLKEIQLAKNEFLILGHTHWPMLKQCGEGFVLNPGSVGNRVIATPWRAMPYWTALRDASTSGESGTMLQVFRSACASWSGIQRRLQSSVEPSAKIRLRKVSDGSTWRIPCPCR